MNTPICDFIDNYIKSKSIRAHMPGHKGEGELEKYDITEISGAESLYSDCGIIRQSEDNATKLFGSLKTCYSTQGSTQCIMSMLHLAKICKSPCERGYILAGRNAHSALISAACHIDFDIKWLYSKKSESYISCTVTASELDKYLCTHKKKPFAVYITSPDYLGNTSDISALSEVCNKHGVLLTVDNAHGAYTKFTVPSTHPLDLGAHMCCDSAHKTLPVLTGGAYLHISKSIPCELGKLLCENIKGVMALYGSTSPSFLTLRSLDAFNASASTFKVKQERVISELEKLKKQLQVCGFELLGKEKLKLTIYAPSYGYTGTEIASILEKNGIFVEFFDSDFVTIMLSACTSSSDIDFIYKALCSIPKRKAIKKPALPSCKPKQKMSIRNAIFAKKERISVQNSLGRILASPCISCPPAVSIAVCGEEINDDVLKLFKYYGTHFVEVVL